MFKRAKKGQSVLEYVLVITAVIAAILVVVLVFLKPRVQDSMGAATQEMADKIGQLQY